MAAELSGVAVFTATTRDRRERLGEQVTAWLAARPTAEVIGYRVTQSSDRTHHCLTIILLLKRR